MKAEDQQKPMKELTFAPKVNEVEVLLRNDPVCHNIAHQIKSAAKNI